MGPAFNFELQSSELARLDCIRKYDSYLEMKEFKANATKTVNYDYSLSSSVL